MWSMQILSLPICLYEYCIWNVFYESYYSYQSTEFLYYTENWKYGLVALCIMPGLYLNGLLQESHTQSV